MLTFLALVAAVVLAGAGGWYYAECFIPDVDELSGR